METLTQQQGMEAGLLDGFDKLAQKLDRAGEIVGRLRSDRDELLALRQQLYKVTGVRDSKSLLEQVGRIREIERENRLLRGERQAMAKRLHALLEKVDLLCSDF